MEKFGDHPGITGQLAKIGSMTPEEAAEAVREAYRTDPVIRACLDTGANSDQIVLVLLSLYNELQEKHFDLMKNAMWPQIIIPKET